MGSAGADLVKGLGEWVTIPCTYAGGARGISLYLDDVQTIDATQISQISRLWMGYQAGRLTLHLAREYTSLGYERSRP